MSLPPEERAIVFDLVGAEELDPNDIMSPLSHVWGMDYHEKPVGVIEFIENTEYIGGTARGVYTKWMEELEYIFSPMSKVTEWILGGAIGVGKSTVAAIAEAYIFYRQACLRNPPGFYGLMESDKLMHGIYSITKTQAADSIYAKMRYHLENSPWFARNYPISKSQGYRMKFERKSMEILVGSREFHCVAKGTFIETPNGPFPIEDLAKQPLVLSWDGEEVYPSVYEGVIHTGRKKCLALTDSFGHTLVCTPDHKVLVGGSKGGWKRAGDIAVGEIVYSLRREEVPAGVLQAAREADGSLQDVRQGSQQREVSPDQDVPRQDLNSCGLGEQEVPPLQGDQACPVLRGSDSEGQEVRAVSLPSVRERGYGRLVSREPGVLLGAGPPTKKQSRVEVKGEGSLGSVLRGEAGGDSCSAIKSLGKETHERDSACVAGEEPGEGSGVSGALLLPRPGEFPQEIPSSGVSEKGPQEERTGHSSARRCDLHAGALSGDVRLLPGVSGGRVPSRSYPATFRGRPDSPSEPCTFVPAVQREEGYEPRLGVHRKAGETPQGRGQDFQVRESRVETIRDVGYRETYDVVNVPRTHAVISNGIVSSNSIGLDLFSFILDEANFSLNTSSAVELKRMQGELSMAQRIYHSSKSRMLSRFQIPGSQDSYGMTMLVSSKNRKTSFLEQHVDAVKEEIAAGQTHVSDFAIWEVKPQKYSLPRFKVSLGNKLHPPKVLDDNEAPPEGCEVIMVPGELKKAFYRDIDLAIKDMAGRAVGQKKPLIRDKTVIVNSAKDYLKHPFTRPVITISTEDRTEIVDYFQPEVMFNVNMSRYELKHNPNTLRALHIDVGLTQDSLGIAMGHISASKEIRRQRADLTHYDAMNPVITIDFVLEIRPPVYGEIDLEKVRSFVFHLRDLGVRFGRISLDGYQSRDTRQVLRKYGFDCEILSVDRTDEPYFSLKQSHVEDRLEMYHYEPYIDQLSELEHFDDLAKVDHPAGGCFVGATRIPLLDGTRPMIEELDGKEVWVYSAKPDGSIVPGRARGRKTKMTQELVDVVLDSGAVERCTPEHRWMLRDGTYKEARDLVPGIDRLMPIRFTWPVNGGYERVTDLHARRDLTHHMVHNAFQAPLQQGHVVHHINHVKTDNRPENLEAGCKMEHSRRHTQLRHDTDPSYRRKLAEGTRRFNNSPEGRRKHSEAMRKTNASRTEESWRSSAEKRRAFRRDITLDSIMRARSQGAQNANQAAFALGCGRNVIVRILKDHGHSSWGELEKEMDSGGLNHKVRHVIPVQLDHPVAVYDLEVDEWSNFALSSGAFVHNSKDVSDAVCGVVYNLLELPIFHTGSQMEERYAHSPAGPVHSHDVKRNRGHVIKTSYGAIPWDKVVGE